MIDALGSVLLLYSRGRGEAQFASLARWSEAPMAFESSDVLLVPTERSEWSDRGVGHQPLFLAGFAGFFKRFVGA